MIIKGRLINGLNETAQPAVIEIEDDKMKDLAGVIGFELMFEF